ncbi:MAG: response regulator [Pseudomonadota bacterium]
MKQDEFVVLLAEDNEHDIVATKRAWRALGLTDQLHIVNDGEECLDYLFRRGKYATPSSAPHPRILLLDINMPRMGGIETLKRIRESREYRYLPVIVLTTSKAEEDQIKSYASGASAYVVKPLGFDNFSAAMKAIHDFWNQVERPKEYHGK